MQVSRRKTPLMRHLCPFCYARSKALLFCAAGTSEERAAQSAPWQLFVPRFVSIKTRHDAGGGSSQHPHDAAAASTACVTGALFVHAAAGSVLRRGGPGAVRTAWRSAAPAQATRSQTTNTRPPPRKLPHALSATPAPPPTRCAPPPSSPVPAAPAPGPPSFRGDRRGAPPADGSALRCGPGKEQRRGQRQGTG